jgi:hypothetical protein
MSDNTELQPLVRRRMEATGEKYNAARRALLRLLSRVVLASGDCWNVTEHIRSLFAEALVAEALYMEDAGTKIQRPRHPGFDVESVKTNRRVDAKTAALLDADLDGTGMVRVLEWDSGSRRLLAKEATHLGLVVLDEDRTHLLLGCGSDSVLAGSVSVHGRVFLVPKDVLTQHARPIWAKRKGRPSKGRFRYLRLHTVEEYELFFTKRDEGNWTVKTVEPTVIGPSAPVAADRDTVELRHS